jgi:hypothetical protein
MLLELSCNQGFIVINELTCIQMIENQYILTTFSEQFEVSDE